MNDHQAPRFGRRSVGGALGATLLSKTATAQTAQPDRLTPPAAAGPATSALPSNAPAHFMRSREAIGILGGSLGSVRMRIADDLANYLRLHSPHVPRIMVTQSYNGVQAVLDALNIEGIDGLLASGVVMDTIRRSGWIPAVNQRLAYVAELYTEEMHIVAAKQITNLQQLNRRIVNVGERHGKTDIIVRRLFELLSITPIYDNTPTPEALRGLPGGTPAAVVLVAGRPDPDMLQIEFNGNLHLVPIPVTPSIRQQIAPLFRAAVLEYTDYPRWIPRGQTLATVSSSVFLLTYVHEANSERKGWISQVVNELLQQFQQLRTAGPMGGLHPKWREANVLTPLPGFARSPEVTAWFNASGLPDAPAR